MSFSMMGSGIYSTTVTKEIICAETCSTCEETDVICDNVWDEDFETDDWGRIYADVICKKCEHKFSYEYDEDEI